MGDLVRRRGALSVPTPTRDTITGEVLDPIVVEVRQHGSEGQWCVFAVDPRSTIEELPLRRQGRILGGTWEEAVADAESLTLSHGFVFQRPTGLWQPSLSTKLILPGGEDG